mmetsp:Transcript_50540/g.114777  ORF Transcript_50540/g.114777 Transcript_50540/m.114777 type:complete len:80 (+) Transcript_50540:925-1164(+)
MYDEHDRPTTREDAIAKRLLARLKELSEGGPAPVGSASSGSWSHGEAAPEEACALVRATGSWLPWEWDKPDRARASRRA